MINNPEQQRFYMKHDEVNNILTVEVTEKDSLFYHAAIAYSFVAGSYEHEIGVDRAYERGRASL